MKKIIISIIFLFCLHSTVYAEPDIIDEQLGILDLHKIVNSFNNSEIIPDFDPVLMIQDISKGNTNVDTSGIINKALSYFFKEVRNNMSILIKIIVICLICAILKTLQENFSGDVSNVAFYACYLIMVSLILVSFKDAVGIGQQAILDMVNFMKIMIPAFVTLIASTGNPLSTTTLYPVIMIVVQFFGSLLSNIMIPTIFFVAILSIVANISEKVQLSKLSALIKTTSIWIMGIMLTVFGGIMSIQSTLAATLDGVTVKTAKFAVSSAIPFVGKILSDSVETILSSTLIIKNSVGIIGVLLILGIVLSPMLKIAAIMAIYKLSAIIAEPIADSRMVRCLDEMGGTLSLLFVTMISISFMFIIAITTMVKVANISTMIR